MKVTSKTRSKVILRLIKNRRTTKKHGGNKNELDVALTNIQNRIYPIARDEDLANIDLFIDTGKNPLGQKEKIETILTDYKTKIEKITPTNWIIEETIKKIEEIKKSIETKERDVIAKKAKAEADALKKMNEKAKADAKKTDALKKAEIDAAEKAKAEQAKRIADQAKAEEKRKVDQAKAEESKLIAEAKRKVDQAKAEEAKIKAEEEKRKAEEEKRKAEEEEEEEEKRIADQPKADETRIADQPKSDETRIADQPKAEEKRIADQPKAEEKRIADFTVIRKTIQNGLLQDLTNIDIQILLSSNIENKFHYVTSRYLNNYNKFNINPHDRYVIVKRKIQHIETIILVLVGILNNKLQNKYKIVLKGGKGLQMALSRVKWENIPTDDIDLLILPFGEYTRIDVKKIAIDISELINILINIVYPSNGVEGISILPEYQSINPNIVKMSYMYYGMANPILDIDFKEDTDNYFSSKTLTETEMYIKTPDNSKTDLLYYHQTIDAFVKEKTAIMKKYSDCICPTDNETTKNVVPTPECEPICPSKKFILEQKFKKYQGLMEYYENQKKSTPTILQASASEFVPGKK